MTDLKRVSRRVIENEARVLEARAKEEAAAIQAVNDSLKTMFGAHTSNSQDCNDFDIPMEWKAELIQVVKAEKSGDCKTVVTKEPRVKSAPIPHYRVLKQNLYKPPMQRPSFSIEDTASCDCKVETGCGYQCHNRMLFM